MPELSHIHLPGHLNIAPRHAARACRLTRYPATETALPQSHCPKPHSVKSGALQSQDTRSYGGPLRARAHAAYRIVESGGVTRLDAALDLYEGDRARLMQVLDSQREALMILGIYAPQGWVRRMARHALTAPTASITPVLPSWLHDPELAEEPGQ